MLSVDECLNGMKDYYDCRLRNYILRGKRKEKKEKKKRKKKLGGLNSTAALQLVSPDRY